jgi:hypothetical protein
MSAQYPGFKEVTKEEFYAFMGNRNVHPSPRGKWNDTVGYVSEWRSLTSGYVYGLTTRTAYLIHL